MTHFRIVAKDGCIIVQRKRWLFWFTEKQSHNGGEVVELKTFASLEEARDYILDDGITEKMVNAVYPYINGSLPLEERKDIARTALRSARRAETGK